MDWSCEGQFVILAVQVALDVLGLAVLYLPLLVLR